LSFAFGKLGKRGAQVVCFTRVDACQVLAAHSANSIFLCKTQSSQRIALGFAPQNAKRDRTRANRENGAARLRLDWLAGFARGSGAHLPADG
jgi:hypothetical protein